MGIQVFDENVKALHIADVISRLKFKEEDFWEDLWEDFQIRRQLCRMKLQKKFYITSDEEIKERDIDKHTCIFLSDNGLITTLAGKGYGRVKTIGKYYKIIQTTDQNFIADRINQISEDIAVISEDTLLTIVEYYDERKS